MKTFGTPPLSLLVWTALSPLALAASTPWFNGLGDLPGGSFQSIVSGISADGSTVCGHSSSTLSSENPQDSEAFRWRAADGMIGLGYLQATETFPFSPPTSSGDWVSENGQRIVGSGYFKSSSLDAFPDQIGVYWDDLSQAVALPLLASASGNFKTAVALGGSADGNFIVGRSSSSIGDQAVVWNLNGDGPVQVTSIGPTTTAPTATGDKLTRTSVALAASSNSTTIVGTGTYTVSNTQTVQPPDVPIYDSQPPYNLIGWYTPPPYTIDTPIEQGTEAFAWRSGVGMQMLGDLNGGDLSSEALAVSSDGSVIVGYGTPAANTNYGLIWTNGAMQSVGDLPDGAQACRLYDVTADGSIAVGLGNDATGRAAVIWNAEGGLQKLSTLASERGVNLTGWTLSTAEGISADGDVIVGNGINPAGEKEAWRLTGVLELLAPPDPVAPSVALTLGNVLTFPTVPDNLYQAQFSYNLSDWLPLGDSHSTIGAAASSTHSVADPTVPGGGKFYRLTLLPGSVSEFPPSFTTSEGAVISFQTQPGFSYQVTQSANLSGWSSLGGAIQTTGDTVGIIHTVFHPFTVFPNPSPASNNYRVETATP